MVQWSLTSWYSTIVVPGNDPEAGCVPAHAVPAACAARRPRVSDDRVGVGARAVGSLVSWGVILLAASVLPASALAQAFPSKPLRVIVSVGAGGATDTLTRRAMERVATALGQSIVVENMAGASGVLAAQTVARAAPDGYTLLVGTNTTHAGNAHFIRNLPYDPVADFAPVARMGVASLVLCVHESVPGTTVQAFVSHAKAHPGRLAFGSGTGSARLATEMLKARAGIDLLAVPYKSNVQALADLRGGQIQVLFGDIALMLPHVKAGAVKALGTSGASRSAAMPDTPTLAEAGIAGYELVGFIAAFAPAKTPDPIVRRLNEEIVRVLRDREFAASLATLGIDAAPTSPEGLRDWVIAETRKWGELARAAGIQPE